MKNSIILVLIFFINQSLAKEGMLIHMGKPIHPKCLEKFTDMPHTKRILRNIKGMGELFTPQKIESFLNLSNCSKSKIPFVVKDDGTINYTNSKATSMRKPMMEYRPLLKFADDKILIEYLWNGGGSGYFSGLQIIKKYKNKLELIGTLPISGDRCNGGFRVESNTAASVKILKNLTPIAIIELSRKGKDLTLAAYEDLEASASSCFARQIILISGSREGLSQKTLGIKVHELGIQELTKTKWNKNYKYQLCFSQTLEKFSSLYSKRFIPIKDLDKFVLAFKNKCLK